VLHRLVEHRLAEPKAGTGTTRTEPGKPSTIDSPVDSP
jgi:hypothetical protein